MFVKLDIKKLFKFCRADTGDEFVRLFPRHTREGLSQENRELIHKKFKGRCNITGIKVYDEARIKSKSVNPLIRLFYFIISMLLLFIWNLHSKKECPFKRFVINLERMLKNVEVSRAN